MVSFFLRLTVSAIAVGLLASTAGCSSGDAAPRFAFSGTVAVDGQPAERMIVQLTHLDPAVDSQFKYVSSTSNAAGEFCFGDPPDGSPSTAKGAVAGQYDVTFFWLSSDGIDATDKLNGKFAEPSRSAYQIILPLDPPDQTISFELKTRP